MYASITFSPSFGGGFFGIRYNARIGWRSNLFEYKREQKKEKAYMGGAISAISMAVIPRDQISQIEEYPSGPIFISTAIISGAILSS